MSEEIREKKDYCYICDGKVLKNNDGLSAKAKKEAEDLLAEIQNSEKVSDDKENEDIKTILFNAFKKGPLHWTPDIKTDHKSYCQTESDSFDAKSKTEVKDGVTLDYDSYKHAHGGIDAIGAGTVDFSFAGVNFAKGQYTAKLKGSCEASYYDVKEEYKENDHRVTNIYAAAKGEIEGSLSAKGEIGLKKYNVSVDADGTLKAKGDCSFLGMETRKYKKDDERGFDLKLLHAKAKAEGSVKGKGSVSLKFGADENKKVEGEFEAEAAGEAKFKLLDVEGSKTSNEVRGKCQVLNAEAKGQACFRTKGTLGDKNVEAQGKVQGQASFKLIDGKMLLTVKKDNDRIHIPGIKGTIGQAKASGAASFNFKTGSEKDERQFGVKGETECTLAKINACKLDIRKKKKYGNMANIKCNSSLVEANVATASIIGKKEGNEIEARLKANETRANVGNVQITGKDDRKKVSASVQSGTSVEVGNVNVTGLGHKGVSMEIDTGPGLQVGNISIGINRDTGVCASTKTSFFNLNLTIGLPRLNFNLGGGGFNFGIPFLSGGGGGGGAGGGGGDKSEGNSSSSDWGIRKCGQTGDYFQSEEMDSDNDDNICDKDDDKGRMNADKGSSDSKTSQKCQGNTPQGNLNPENDQNNFGTGNVAGSLRNTWGSDTNGLNEQNDGVGMTNEGTRNRTSDEVEYGDFTDTGRELQGNVIENCSIGSDGHFCESSDDCLIVIDNPNADEIESIAEYFEATEIAQGSVRGTRLNHYSPMYEDKGTSRLDYDLKLQFSGHSNDAHNQGNLGLFNDNILSGYRNTVPDTPLQITSHSLNHLTCPNGQTALKLLNNSGFADYQSTMASLPLQQRSPAYNKDSGQLLINSKSFGSQSYNNINLRPEASRIYSTKSRLREKTELSETCTFGKENDLHIPDTMNRNQSDKSSIQSKRASRTDLGDYSGSTTENSYFDTNQHNKFYKSRNYQSDGSDSFGDDTTKQSKPDDYLSAQKMNVCGLKGTRYENRSSLYEHEWNFPLNKDNKPRSSAFGNYRRNPAGALHRQESYTRKTLKSKQNTVQFPDYMPSELKESFGVIRDTTSSVCPPKETKDNVSVNDRSESKKKLTDNITKPIEKNEKKTSLTVTKDVAADKQKSLNLKDISDYNKHMRDILLKKIGYDFETEHTKPQKYCENKYDWSNTKKVKEDLLRACRSSTSGDNGGRKGG